MKREKDEEQIKYEEEITQLNEKLSKLDDLFHEKLIKVLENSEINSSKTPEQNESKAFNSCDKQELENNFTLEDYIDEIKEISLSKTLLKEHFSSEENFFCKLCDNIIVNITQCSVCEILYCKKCITIKLETGENCPNCNEQFEFGNVPKITKNILNAFRLNCPFKCDEELIYSNVFSHLNECGNKGKVFICNICNDKVLVSKLNSNNFHKILYDHYEMCPERNSNCKFCKLEFLKKDLKIHMENCEERNIKCEKCLFIYPFKMTLITLHDEIHCEEIRKLRKNLELFGKKNGI